LSFRSIHPAGLSFGQAGTPSPQSKAELGFFTLLVSGRACAAADAGHRSSDGTQ
jgi:hypothetical protein